MYSGPSFQVTFIKDKLLMRRGGKTIWQVMCMWVFISDLLSREKQKAIFQTMLALSVIGSSYGRVWMLSYTKHLGLNLTGIAS